MKSIALTLAVASTLLVPVANGAEPKAKAVKSKAIATKTAATAPAFEPRFWDASAPIQSYEANDPEKVFKWLGKRIGEVPGIPDKFSPPDQDAKWKADVATALSGVGAIPMSKECGKKYDPAKQQYEISVFVPSPPDDIKLDVVPHELNLRTLHLKTNTIKEENVVAQNGYGAKFDVLKRTTEDWEILYSGLPGNEPTSIFKEPEKEKAYFEERAKLLKHSSASFRETMIVANYKYKSTFYRMVVPMTPDEARVDDENIRCMYVASGQPPFIRSHDQYLPATRNYPKESTIYNHYFYGKLDRVIVYNKVSGKLYVEAKRDGI